MKMKIFHWLNRLVRTLIGFCLKYQLKLVWKETNEENIGKQCDWHHLNEVMSKFVSRKFLDHLGRDCLSELALGDHTTQELTVFFSDIRDYIGLSENMTPEENYCFVNAYYGKMGPVIHQHNGFVNQYLGDAIKAVFPQYPGDAIQAAIKMQQLLRCYNQDRKVKRRRTIKVGMGLHNGPVIMGIIGDDNRMDAAAIADTVNTASRIENLTKYYNANILLSENTLKKIQTNARCTPHLIDDNHFRYLGLVLIKGKQEPLGIYECFGGDEPKFIDLKLESLSFFNSGFHHFSNKEFKLACLAFREVLKINPSDKTAQLLLHKSTDYAQRGVHKNWAGIQIMYKK